MCRSRLFLTFFLVVLITTVCRAHAEGPFVGLQVGASEPTNGNFRGQVQTGATTNPYGGYMFNRYVGLQGQLNFMFQEPDNDHRGTPHENQTTTIFGATIGPRLALPLGDLYEPLGDLFELYGTVQGGPYTGLSGRSNHTNGGFLAGFGLDYNITPKFAVGLFGFFNRIYVASKPTILGGRFPQVDEEQGPADAQFATAGISVKYNFFAAEEAPPPPPPPPPAPQPEEVRKRIILRAVHFDFDKYNLRPDAVPILDEAVQLLKKDGDVAIICQGHTDSVGTVKYNLKLSKRRAESVTKYLVKHGISADRITVEGLGKSHPVATNATREGRAQNRRVEIYIE